MRIDSCYKVIYCLCLFGVSSQQLNAEVEYLVKTSELLALKGIPTKEKNERVTELLQLHQQVKDKIKEYESVLSMAVKFNQLYEEVSCFLCTFVSPD